MSTNLTEVDEALWERYLMDLRTLAEDNELNPNTMRPSIKDYLVWLQDQDLDEPIYEELLHV